MSGKPIILGESDQGALEISPTTRSTHLHVIGGTGVGKSYLLEHMIRRDIRSGHGVCLIDPHGETYNNIVEWLARSQYRWPVHLLNPSDEKWSLGFNPLCSGDANPEVRVDAMADACMKVWGADENETPRLSKCLRLTLYALAVHRLSVLESGLLTSSHNASIRQKLTADLPNEAFADEWREFNDSYSPQQFTEYFESTRSRMLPFISSPPIRRLMGQTDGVLDLGKAMDRGDIVLVNLAPKGDMTTLNARLIGAMLFSDLIVTARRRDVRRAGERPFYCYVDECADYLTDDIARILDQTRKFGLHLTLAHQRLQQLRQAGEAVYSGVMESAKSKVVFRVDDDDSAEILSRHLFRKGFDLERPKESMIRPTVVGQERVILHSESETTTESEADGFAEGNASSTNSSAGESVFVPDTAGFDATGRTEILGSGEGTTASTSRSHVRGSSTANTLGTSEGLANIFADLPTALHTLEELIHEGIVKVRSLPNRQAIVYIAGEAYPISMTTPDVKRRFVLPKNIHRYIDEINERNSWVSRAVEIEAEIALRKEQWIEPEPRDQDYFE